jgi:hypothetical protein
MLPFDVDQSWYRDYWYAEERAPKRQGLLRFAMGAATCAAVVALIVLVAGLHIERPQLSNAKLSGKATVWNAIP